MLLLLACHPDLSADTTENLVPRDECNPGCFSVSGPEIQAAWGAGQDLAFRAQKDQICFDWLPVGTYALTLKSEHASISFPVDIRPFGYDQV